MRIVLTLALVLASGAAMAQSADPAKRELWYSSMSQCLRGIDDHPETVRPILTEACRDFADQQISDSYGNRLRALLQSGETLAEPVPESVIHGRMQRESRNAEMHRQQLGFIEAHVRLAVLEECLFDPAKLSPHDCNRIAGLDVIRAKIEGDNETADGEN